MRKKKEKKGILDKDIVYHKILITQSYLNNGFLPKSWGIFKFFLVLFCLLFFPRRKIHPLPQPPLTHTHTHAIFLYLGYKLFLSVETSS